MCLLYEAMGLQMVGGHHRVIYPEVAAECCPRGRRKLSAPVRNNGLWHAKACNPGREEDLYTGGDCDALEWNSLQPAGGSVHHQYEVHKTILRRCERTYQIPVHVAESSGWYGNGLHGRPRLLSDLGPLARHAVPTLGGHVCPHPRPNETC
jgi:hypothetical protein